MVASPSIIYRVVVHWSVDKSVSLLQSSVLQSIQVDSIDRLLIPSVTLPRFQSRGGESSHRIALHRTPERWLVPFHRQRKSWNGTEQTETERRVVFVIKSVLRCLPFWARNNTNPFIDWLHFTWQIDLIDLDAGFNSIGLHWIIILQFPRTMKTHVPESIHTIHSFTPSTIKFYEQTGRIYLCDLRGAALQNTAAHTTAPPGSIIIIIIITIRCIHSSFVRSSSIISFHYVTGNDQNLVSKLDAHFASFCILYFSLAINDAMVQMNESRDTIHHT